MALAVVYIQQRLGVTDQETVELIMESPCLQFFIALRSYQAVSPFDPSMMVHFRKCLGPDLIKICKEMAMPKASRGLLRLLRLWRKISAMAKKISSLLLVPKRLGWDRKGWSLAVL